MSKKWTANIAITGALIVAIVLAGPPEVIKFLAIFDVIVLVYVLFLHDRVLKWANRK